MKSAIEQIQKWLQATDMSESRLGLLAVANARAIGRIRNGTAQIGTLQAVLDYIKEHPADATIR